MKRGFVLLVTLLVFGVFSVGYGLAEVSKRDINTATVEDLVQVKGIGQKKAELIVKYISSRGRIEDMKELLEVKGIGQSTLEKIKELFEVKPLDKEAFKKSDADSSH
ncbi:MAG: helix-hairpin-helix domain-containing protein [Nitrospirae bacterium]|nr:helix-hairpin-helix domain-containing protein [Nitrospirota bacterium]